MSALVDEKTWSVAGSDLYWGWNIGCVSGLLGQAALSES